MAEKGFRQFTIDPEFKALIRPLSKEEYAQLEANLVYDGCREPIAVWMGFIVDGHNRYEICNRLHIPYGVVAYDFRDREEAIIWICKNQLGRRNIADETRKYLIGKQYEAEKYISMVRNEHGTNQYRGRPRKVQPPVQETEDGYRRESGRRTANRLGEKYHISSGAVQKYSKYSQAVDKLGQKAPELVPQILAGTFKISHDNLISLVEMSPEEIRRTVGKGIGSDTPQFRKYSESRQSMLAEAEKKPPEPKPDLPAIKKMPEYDPDSEVTGLMLTIPSWKSSIERTLSNSNMAEVSLTVKGLFREALSDLKEEIDKALETIKEDS